MLEAVLNHVNQHAKIPLCGMISGYNKVRVRNQINGIYIYIITTINFVIFTLLLYIYIYIYINVTNFVYTSIIHTIAHGYKRHFY